MLHHGISKPLAFECLPRGPAFASANRSGFVGALVGRAQETLEADVCVMPVLPKATSLRVAATSFVLAMLPLPGTVDGRPLRKGASRPQPGLLAPGVAVCRNKGWK